MYSRVRISYFFNFSLMIVNERRDIYVTNIHFNRHTLHFFPERTDHKIRKLVPLDLLSCC